MERENVSFLKIGENSLPREVYAVLLDELLKIEKGRDKRRFAVEKFDCTLIIYRETCHSLGSCASGIVCDVFVKLGDELHSQGRFLANVKESQPPQPGSLRLSLY